MDPDAGRRKKGGASARAGQTTPRGRQRGLHGRGQVQKQTGHVLTVGRSGHPRENYLTARSVRARTAGQAEEIAIALAMDLPGYAHGAEATPNRAVRNFARGVVWNGTAKLAESQGASRALEQQAKKNVVIKWFPAHAGRESGTRHQQSQRGRRRCGS
ncbi:hypothetical protein HPB48_021290 [Haemaphysalis longicornis]|uniref:Uncharacterized protein n=1 Tax=Haemaphysalis longicornis TaxID=44386 RepID=A0A9J6FX89_HAELO|nr:hypothetical protein HPB48_021290 [Haemaphysalis longicornis]